MVKIFIGGLPPDISEMDLVIFVSLYAEVATIKIVRDKVTRESKGYAFLEMKNAVEADKAVDDLNGALFKGNTLTVKLAEVKPAKPTTYAPVGKDLKSKRPRLKS
jgi:RNA recognition motif-containing protein